MTATTTMVIRMIRNKKLNDLTVSKHCISKNNYINNLKSDNNFNYQKYCFEIDCHVEESFSK